MSDMTNNEAREILIDFHTNRQVKYHTDPNHTYNELLTQAIDCAIQALGDGWVSDDQIKAEADSIWGAYPCEEKIHFRAGAMFGRSKLLPNAPKAEQK